MKKDPNNKFRKIRRLNNLTQAEEAKLLNVSIHHISEFENASPQEGNGSMDISLSLILKISYRDAKTHRALNVRRCNPTALNVRRFSTPLDRKEKMCYHIRRHSSDLGVDHPTLSSSIEN